MVRTVWGLWALVCGGCSVTQVIPLKTSYQESKPPPAAMSVTVRPGAVIDPVHIQRSRIAFGGLSDPLALSIRSSVAEWAQSHQRDRPQGWQLLVELTRGDALRRHHTVTVTLAARATLRATEGSRYLAQTQVHCVKAGLVAPVDAAPLLSGCMDELSHEISGWLGGVTP